MRCPYCGQADTRVLESRTADDEQVIRRRRECGACLRRFTTYERIEEPPLMVVKKDGRREAFDRSKILRGLIRSCEKRPVPEESLEALTQDVERALRETGEREVTSSLIGEMVMDRLRSLDEVAYVRFASVYRQFRDAQHFQDELERLLRERDRQPGSASQSGGTPHGDIR